MNKDAYRDAVFAAVAKQHITPQVFWQGDKLQVVVPPHSGFDRSRFERDLDKRLNAHIAVTKTTYR